MSKKQIFYFTKTVTKSLTITDTKKRLFEGIVTVEMVDKQGEVTIRDELLKTFPIWMDRGASLTDTHSNRVIGKGLNYSPVDVIDPKTKKKYFGIKILGKIYDDTQLDDEIWKNIQTGKYKGLSFGGATKSDRIPVKQSDGSIAYHLKDLEMYEIAVCAEPAVELALITDFNHLAKSMPADKMCGMSWEELDNDKIRVKCDNFKCYVIRDSDNEILKSWNGQSIETVDLGTNDDAMYKSSSAEKLDNNMSEEDKIRKEDEDKKEDKEEEKKAEDDKKENEKDEEKKSRKQKQEDDKKEDDDKKEEKSAVEELAGLVGTLVKTITSEKKASNKRFDDLSKQIKALETPAPAEEHATNTPVKLNNEYNDEPGSDTRASEDPKDPADKESEDGTVEFEEKHERVEPIMKATTPRPNTNNEWINKNRGYNSVLARARELGPEQFSILTKEVIEGVHGKVDSNPEGYPEV